MRRYKVGPEIQYDLIYHHLIVRSPTMLSFLTVLTSISLASAAVVQLPPNIAQAVAAPSSDSYTQLVKSNGSLSFASPATALTGSGLNATLSGGPPIQGPVVKYTCDGGKWDRDLNPKSCLSAWESIPRAAGPVLTFGSRDADERYGIGLPKRYLSCEYPWNTHLDGPSTEAYKADGTCAIEPLLLPGRSFAKAKLADLALASSVVIDGCVDGKSSTGGLVWNFGKAPAHLHELD